jgi:sterol desaturase/sphingolipid hydroxylase (fatty acid hydroxylase superfamily)
VDQPIVLLAVWLPALLLLVSLAEIAAPLRTDRSRTISHKLHNMLFAATTASVMYAAYALFFGGALRSSAHFGLFHWVAAPTGLQIACLVVAVDCWYYSAHRLSHHYPLLWRVHRTHHSDVQVDATTNFRTHFIEFVWLSAGKLSLALLLGINPLYTIVYDLMSGTLGTYYHSNIVINESLDRWVRLVFVSQKWHLSHHSNDEQYTNGNYSLLFTWWDRLFGTAHMDPYTKTIVQGIEQLDGVRWQTLRGLWLTPFMRTAPAR